MIDWPSCNHSPVRRSQYSLDFDLLDGWDHELSQMNHGKIGGPFDYQDSFIQLLGYMRAYFRLPYRRIEGVVIAHARTKVPCIQCFRTINGRINRLEIKINQRKIN